MRLLKVSLFIFSCLPFMATGAEDAIQLDETVIRGNQELPKVLYILPWREMPTELLPRRQVDFSVPSVLKPIYPDEQRRQLQFRQLLHKAREARASAIRFQ